jgi:hypothetical protein
VALAIKNARELALLPYAVRTLAGDKSAGRRGRGGPGGRPDRPAGPSAAPVPPGAADAAPSATGDASGPGDTLRPITDETVSVASTPVQADPVAADDGATSNDDGQG